MMLVAAGAVTNLCLADDFSKAQGSGGDFGKAQWIGAITQKDARLPVGRNFTGAKLKEAAVKEAWAAVDTLAHRSIYLKRDITLRGKVRQATVYICGLGFYELSINGMKIGESEFAPLWSDYDKSVFYNTYDVTQWLMTAREMQNKTKTGTESKTGTGTESKTGTGTESKTKTKTISKTTKRPNGQTTKLYPHCDLLVLLGNGFYCEPGLRYAKMKIAFGPPTLLFRLHIVYEDGTEEDVVTDEQWQWALSPITFNSIYGGEDYDARLEATASNWHSAVIQEAPKGVLRRQIAEPVKIMERHPVKDTVVYSPLPRGEEGGGLLVLDMGQNLSGFPEITVEGKCGQRLKLTPGETLTPDGLVNQKQTGRPHYFTYILKSGNEKAPPKSSPQGKNLGRWKQINGNDNGKERTEVWHPRFSYYGYRYLQVEGDIEVLKKVESCFVYNSAKKTGAFECSNPLLNDAYRLIDRAIRSNWQAVWTDCPHREKLGWLEQDWLNGEGLLANYDCRSMIEQTMQNIADAQFENGALPEIAPNLCVFEGAWAPPFLESPEWGGAFIALPFLYRDYYGDDKIIARYLPMMKRYVDYLATQDSAYILKQGLGDWYDYGPGRAGFAQNTPMPLVSTAHYYWWNRLMGEARADSIREAFIKEFYHPETHLVGTGSQCAQAIALEMALIPEADRQAVLDSLVSDIHRHGDRLTTGDVGNRYLFNALIHNGQQELLYKMLNHYDVPGYGYQIKLGHTTLTEQWNPEHGASMNHFMMGHLNNILVPYILGIWRENGETVIAPHPIGDLTWCKGESHGISVSWYYEGDTFVVSVDVPDGQQTTVLLPYSGQRHHVGGGHYILKELKN